MLPPMQSLTGLLLLTLLAIVVAIARWDKRKRRLLERLPEVSFVVPCYNAAGTIGDTLESIFSVAGDDADVIVIDDRSTDDSLEVLERLAREFPVRLVRNGVNLGKSVTLNRNFRRASHDIVFFVDADVIVNRFAFSDTLARLQDDRVGAVSCPYAPANKGFLPLMQHIEYNMLALVQGAYNILSAISLWGGFLVVKKQAFETAGGFSSDAITEDMDLAFKLIETGWRVEQSFVPVKTQVPDKIGTWFKQKLRWHAGGIQASLRHYRVWIRNPMHMLLMLSFSAVIGLSLASLVQDITVWQNVFSYFTFVSKTVSLLAGFKLTGLLYGARILVNGLWMLAFTLFALPYVLPLVSETNKFHLCLLVVPFSMLYFPLSAIVFLMAGVSLVYRVRRLRRGVRAW